MKRSVILFLVLILVIPSILAASCGDGTCESSESNHNSANYCPEDCEGGSGGSCYDSTDCDAGLVCVKKQCVSKSAIGANTVVTDSTIESKQTGLARAAQISDGAGNSEDALSKYYQKYLDRSQKLLVTPDQDALEFNPLDESYILQVYDYELSFKKEGEGTGNWADGFLILNENLVVYGPDGNGLTSHRVLLKNVDKDHYEIFSFFEGVLSPIMVQNFGEYGVAIASVGDVPIYTSSVEPDLKIIIGPYLVAITENGPIVHNVEQELAECADGVDNEEDGYVDYKGVCEVSEKSRFMCFCDYDGSGTDELGEYVDETFCGEDSTGDGVVDIFYYDYYCQDFTSGETVATTCSELGGTYYWFDEACTDEDASEGDSSCVSKNIVEMGITCGEIYGMDPELCLELYPSDMEAICSPDTTVSCVVPEDCEIGYICDTQDLVCVDAKMKISQDLAQGNTVNFCTDNFDCNTKTESCQEGVCVEDLSKVGLITYDNPVLGFMAKTVDRVNLAINVDDEQFQKEFVKKQALQNSVLEDKKESGKGFTKAIEKAQKTTINNMATSIEKQGALLANRLAEDSTDTGAKVAAMKLATQSTVVGKVAARNGAQTEEVKKLIRALEKSGENLGEHVPQKIKQTLAGSKDVAEGKKVPVDKTNSQKIKNEIDASEKAARSGTGQQGLNTNKLPPAVKAQIEGRISTDGKAVIANEVEGAKKKFSGAVTDKTVGSAQGVTKSASGFNQLAKGSTIRRGDVKGSTQGEFVPKNVQKKLGTGEFVSSNGKAKAVNEQSKSAEQNKLKGRNNQLALGSKKLKNSGSPEFEETQTGLARNKQLVGQKKLDQDGGSKKKLNQDRIGSTSRRASNTLDASKKNKLNQDNKLDDGTGAKRFQSINSGQQQNQHGPNNFPPPNNNQLPLGNKPVPPPPVGNFLLEVPSKAASSLWNHLFYFED